MEKSLHLQDHHQIRLNWLIACIHYIRHSLVWTPDPSGCVRKGLENNFVRNWLSGMPWFLNPANCSDLQSDSSGTTLLFFFSRFLCSTGTLVFTYPERFCEEGSGVHSPPLMHHQWQHFYTTWGGCALCHNVHHAAVLRDGMHVFQWDLCTTASTFSTLAVLLQAILCPLHNLNASLYLKAGS